MNSNSNNNLDPPDPFDPKSLRIDPANDPGSGVKKLLLHVPVRKPHRQEFFRCRRDPDYRVPMAILELKEEREFYAVTPAVAADLAGEVRSVEMRICTSRSGAVFLWPVPLPAEDGRRNAWHETAREAAEHAETKWVRMSANMGAGCYDVSTAPDGLSDPNWPEHSFGDLLRLAFGKGRLIDAFEHPVLKRLRGE
jgi:hypothetical protein